MSNQLVIPMVFYVFYMGLLGIVLFRVRVGAVKKGNLSIKYFRDYQGVPPEKITVFSRHFDNQFQAPLLFFAGGAVHLALDYVTIFTIVLAWSFVASRILHSIIHLTKNNVLHRAKAFGLGWLILMIFWGELGWYALIK